jgi:hypothetical protein
MARTTQALLDRLVAFLPPQYETAEPLLAGNAAAMREAELVAEGSRTVLSLGGSDGIWLDLHGDGMGAPRTIGESDPQYRGRLRNVEERLTRRSILAAADELLAPFGETATMLEWWVEPYLDVDSAAGAGGLYLGSTFISGGSNTFVLQVPQVGIGFSITTEPHLDVSAWLDSAFLGDDRSDPVYAAIIAEVNRLRAAGIRWVLFIGDLPP